ncbi:beta-eliminating lyase-related protein [Streptomyces sp. D2-8]|uniref:beta-eliminating lyase-related protein n=1 Tax=Streptomyces sp. D2-8 TaxID=2707767 RepID=UPI0020BF6759|nr:beta-eliminating lyase-related protein [Streptomyces sp. D2-8]
MGWPAARRWICPAPQARDLDGDEPFKGNIDLHRLEEALRGPDASRIAHVIMTLTNNGEAGQPVSMDNLARAASLCREHSVPLFLDAARFAENAWLVTQHEAAYRDMSPRQTEGFPAYGGLAGRDLEMIARGLTEVTDPCYLRARADATRHLARLTREAGIAIVEPPGLHALYLNAGRLLPHIAAHRFPGHALACQLYLEGGIRSVGYRLVEQPPLLRHFRSKPEPVPSRPEYGSAPHEG